MLCNGPDTPAMVPAFRWGICISSNTWLLRSTRLSIPNVPNSTSIGSAVFAQLTAERPYTLQFTMGRPFPSKLPIPMGIWISIQHGSLGQPQSIIQMAYRSVRPFCGAQDGNRQTDGRTSVTICRIYVGLRSTAVMTMLVVELDEV